jgi:subtilisin family serine protease
MNPLDMINLSHLMKVTAGQPEMVIGLVDGPVSIGHPDLLSESIREIPGKLHGTCTQVSSAACLHGTFVAGILCGKRTSATPGICPNCTLLVRPIFAEEVSDARQMPSATPEELAEGIIDCIEAGARVLNLSAAPTRLSLRGVRELEEALDYAARRGTIVVAAAGNQGTLGSSPITRHPWVIAIAACDLQGRPMGYSNLGHSIGRRGLRAPGENITGVGAEGKPLILSGTSVAAPFVTGAIALMWSEFLAVGAAEVKVGIAQSHSLRRTTVVPPMLDAWGMYQFMRKARFPAKG